MNITINFQLVYIANQAAVKVQCSKTEASIQKQKKSKNQEVKTQATKKAILC